MASSIGDLVPRGKRATAARHSVIEGNGLLLIDSGGQYVGGTTDITRVVGVGRITGEHRRDFTLVLKAMIALSSARFPRGVKSPMLDAIARAPLWAARAWPTARSTAVLRAH